MMGGSKTKKQRRLIAAFAVSLLLGTLFALPVLAITEAEVEAEVSASGKEAVVGNVLIWFLCAVAFLKVSHSIEAFLASLGVSSRSAGKSLLAEALIATRGLSAFAGLSGHAVGGAARGAGGTAAGLGGYFKGGLVGMASRRAENDAVKTATSNTTIHAASTKQTVNSKAQTHLYGDGTTTGEQHSSPVSDTGVVIGDPVSSPNVTGDTKPNERTADQEQMTGAATHKAENHVHAGSKSFKSYGIGGAMFMKSLSTGGSFANEIISRVARGDMQSTGTISGEMAAQALNSYMGVTAMGADTGANPSYYHVEMGGGRISGLERAANTHQDVPFCMYDASQYAEPQGEHTKVYTADGAAWYKQYAQDAVERKPYMAQDGSVAYHESIVQRMPTPPQRKSRI